jgi:hypothetical protein
MPAKALAGAMPAGQLGQGSVTKFANIPRRWRAQRKLLQRNRAFVVRSRHGYARMVGAAFRPAPAPAPAPAPVLPSR